MGPGKDQEDAAISIKPISTEGSRRIVKYAFEYAKANSRRKVTAVSKANIMKFTDGLFYASAREVAKEYEGEIEYEEVLVDAICMQLVQKPENYDVLVMPNLYGDIVSDVGAGLIGGLGVAPGANIGDGVAIFEPTHGSAPKYKGQNKVNPTALILSGMLMLRHLGRGGSRRPPGKGSRCCIGRGTSRHLRPQGRSERSDGGQHDGDGRGDRREAGVGRTIVAKSSTRRGSGCTNTVNGTKPICSPV